MAGQSDDYPGNMGVNGPGETWVLLTPSDSVNFAKRPKAIAVGSTAGSFQAVGNDNVAGTFYGAAGQILHIRPIRINAAGLTGGMTFLGLY